MDQSPRDADPQLSRPVRDEDVIFAYRFFLGRDPESPEAVADRRGADRRDLVTELAGSGEYATRFVRPVLQGRAPADIQFAAPPTPAVLAWAAGFLSLEDGARGRVAAAPNWIAAHGAVVADPRFRAGFPRLAETLPLDALADRLGALTAELGARSPMGEVEEATGQIVRGFALDRNAPDAPLGVELWIDGRFAAATRADVYGRELQGRFGGSGRHGFAFEDFAPPDPQEERAIRVEVRESGSKLALGSRDVVWRPAQETRPLAVLAEELRAARKALAGIERTLQLVSGALGFTPQTWDAYRRAYYVRTPAQELRGAREAQDFAWRPRLEVCVPADARDQVVLDATLAALRGQIHAPQNAQAWTPGAGADFADADYVVLLDAGDTPAPDLLHRVAAGVQAEPRPALVTWDTDTRDADGFHRDPVLRPAFDYDLLLQTPYLGGSAAVRADVLREVLAAGGDLAPDRRADLWLRVVEEAGPEGVLHLPRVLVHTRDPGPSPTPDYASVVRAHLARIGAEATVEAAADPLGEAGPVAARLRVSWPVPAGTRAAVIVPTRDRLDLLGPCLASLEGSKASNAVAIEVVVVDNGSAEATTRRTLDALASAGRIRLLRHPDPFNWSAINNVAARSVEADVLVFLNNDTVVLTPDWCDELCAQALRPQVGAVGARLLYEDASIQHAGIVLGTAQALAAHEGAGAPATDDGYLGRRGLVHRAAAVTGACLATRREVFDRLGGFDEAQLAIEANDIDYCLRVRHAGLAVLYDPRCTLYHFESRSRGHTGLDPERRRQADAQLAALDRRWGEETRRDPWYNPHFDRLSRPFLRLGPPPEL